MCSVGSCKMLTYVECQANGGDTNIVNSGSRVKDYYLKG